MDFFRTFVEDNWEELLVKIIKEQCSASHLHDLAMYCDLESSYVDAVLHNNPYDIHGASYELICLILHHHRDKTVFELFLMFRRAFCEMNKPGLFRSILHEQEKRAGVTCHCNILQHFLQ